ncbi:hypothetical protein RHMOL_Rhmol06G0158000 [Rhododendron molle]|uniref:Uncharacterized protein n=1 Tax=Rhododendron molle TaxID=49168 RepID=A0ACC0NCN2_RHOML|nr:hypothetical protein RHMOL_Rhmol06G0158000 [Rhododendron molle]
MGMTLEDVQQLLGILVTGLTVFMEDKRDAKNLLMTMLCVSKDVVKAELSCGSVKLSWLEMYFREVNEGDTDVRVDHCALAYLLSRAD